MSRSAALAAALPAGQRVEAEAWLDLEPDPERVREARRFVLAQAPPLSEDGRHTLELLTSELVTNAVIHARTSIRLGIGTSADFVVVTVHDLDVGHTEREPLLREGGWGLGMVAALADQAATDRHPGGGKTAWFRLRRSA